MPAVALICRASSRAIARVTSFSRLPVGPMAPGSCPPWPGSIAITRGRMPARMAMRGSGWTGASAGCCATTAGGTSGCGCVRVSPAVDGTSADARPLRISCGEGLALVEGAAFPTGWVATTSACAGTVA